MRARYPDREGVTSSAGVPIAWEEYGRARRGAVPPALADRPQPHLEDAARLLRPPLPRRSPTTRPATGAPDRPATGYDHDRAAADALAVLDADGDERASLVGFSRSAWQAVHPRRAAPGAGRAAGPGRARR